MYYLYNYSAYLLFRLTQYQHIYSIASVKSQFTDCKFLHSGNVREKSIYVETILITKTLVIIVLPNYNAFDDVSISQVNYNSSNVFTFALQISVNRNSPS